MALSTHVKDFPPSVFTEINVLARQHNAVNLSQGAPDFNAPPLVIAAAVEALQSGQFDQYAPSLGRLSLRKAIADHGRRRYGHEIDPESDVLVMAGASLGIFMVIMGLVSPGDEVIVFEPFFDTYVPNIWMAGGIPRYVPLRPPNWEFDADELAAAFNERTKAIIINTPHNPTGKVFSQRELTLVADLCQQWDVIAISDEVYEHLTYDGAQHLRLATLPGMGERTLTLSSLGKTFSVTGWKIGWGIGTPELLEGVNRVHAFTLFTVVHPLQEAAAIALNLPDSFFEELTESFQAKRDTLLQMLAEAGLKSSKPQGGYYIMADFSDVFDGDDMDFARYMIRDVGVACIPATAFFSEPHKHLVRQQVRFTFCKKAETLQAAAERLARLR